MCGITGYIDSKGCPDPEMMISIVQKMTSSIRHRGPDDAGTWIERESGLALGHRRLSIIELSSLGKQPMMSSSGRYIIVYNGEVYNFQALREELAGRGHAFANASDTAVILAAIEEWGPQKAVERFVGMFAFALWDRTEKRLFLVRDRMGIKPLYYGWAGSVFLFGSELKALRAHPAWQGEIDRDNLLLYLRHNYVPHPYTIFKGIYTLPPGTMLPMTPYGTPVPSFSPFSDEVEQGFACQPQTWWSTKNVYEHGYRAVFEGSAAEAVTHLEDRLVSAVQCRMISDVPIGAFLSGGVDSSMVVALMQSQSRRPVRTFTVGFFEDLYNEAPYARAISEHLGTDHTELYVTPDEAMAVIPNLPDLYDEPFADSSQIPTFMISALARQHVTVSLSGDGGDELFGGYIRYEQAPRLWSKLKCLPYPLRLLGQKFLTCVSLNTWERMFKILRPLLPKTFQGRIPGDSIYKGAEILSATSPHQLYRFLISQFKDPCLCGNGLTEPPEYFSQGQRHVEIDDLTKWMMFTDLVTYHPDDILVKVDRASMGIGLETRVPLIDHRVVEFAATLPSGLLYRDGKNKWLLRQLLYKYVPPRLIERPKKGFSIPIGSWLKGPLKEWAADLLNEHRLKQDGLLEPRPILQMWREHLAGTRDWQYRLWVVLMFQAWRERWR